MDLPPHARQPKRAGARRHCVRGRVRDAVVCRSSRQPSQISAVSRRQSAARRRRARGLRRRRHACPGTKLPDPLMWAPMKADELIKTPEGGDQRLRLRAGLPQERAAGAFRLHGLGHRRRGDAARATARTSSSFSCGRAGWSTSARSTCRPRSSGVKYNSPIVLAPVGGQRSFHDEGEVASARAAKVGNHLQILSTATSLGVEDVTAGRGAPLWYQLYATNKWEVAEAMVKRVEKAGALAVAVTVDRSGGRNQETLFRLRPSDTRDCNQLSRPLQPAGEHEDPGDVPGHRPLRAHQHPVLGHDLGFLQAHARPHQDEDRRQGHSRLGGRGARGRRRPRRHHRLQPRRAQRGFRPLDHRRAAGDRRGRERPHPDPGRFRLPPRLRHHQGALHGGDGGLCRPALHLGARRLRPARRRARARAPCASRPTG